MNICLSDEAKKEMHAFGVLDRDVGIALEACIEMAAVEPGEFEGEHGFSIQRIGFLWRKGIRVYRIKYEGYIPGIRILFFVVAEKSCVFVTGVHARGDLGPGKAYESHREAFVRAQRYWGLRSKLCL